MKIIEINREPVELYKVLKFEGLASSGGEAKQWIADERVEVNGMIETRKRRKLVHGDQIELSGQRYRLELR
jgi:ribosome-associated protein